MVEKKGAEKTNGALQAVEDLITLVETIRGHQKAKEDLEKAVPQARLKMYEAIRSSAPKDVRIMFADRKITIITGPKQATKEFVLLMKRNGADEPKYYKEDHGYDFEFTDKNMRALAKSSDMSKMRSIAAARR